MTDKVRRLTKEQWDTFVTVYQEAMAEGQSQAWIERKLKLPHSTVTTYVAHIRKGTKPSLVLGRSDLIKLMAGLLMKLGVNTIQREHARKIDRAFRGYDRFFDSWDEFVATAAAENAVQSIANFKFTGAKDKHDAEEPLSDRERRRFEDQLRGYKNRVTGLERELNEIEDIRAAIFKLADTEIIPPAFPVNYSTPDKAPGTPILFFSDAQWGERILASELDGINAYDMGIASERYQTLIKTTVELTHKYQVNPEYQKMVLLRAGDLINGDIHEELRETNDLSAIPACKDLAEHEIWGINELLKHFPYLEVVTVPGNHGRNTMKPTHKGFTGNNYETLSAYLLEAWFQGKGEDRVRFITPASGDAIINVEGHNFCITHGDRIGSRGGEGFIGPAATIMRGMSKVHAYYHRLRRPVDYVLTGHFHTSLYLGVGFANGSLAGFNEYAKSFRMIPDAPKQWLLFAHPRFGVSQKWEIQVGPKPVFKDHESLNFNPRDFGITPKDFSME